MTREARTSGTWGPDEDDSALMLHFTAEGDACTNLFNNRPASCLAMGLASICMILGVRNKSDPSCALINRNRGMRCQMTKCSSLVSPL